MVDMDDDDEDVMALVLETVDSLFFNCLNTSKITMGAADATFRLFLIPKVGISAMMRDESVW